MSENDCVDAIFDFENRTDLTEPLKALVRNNWHVGTNGLSVAAINMLWHVVACAEGEPARYAYDVDELATARPGSALRHGDPAHVHELDCRWALRQIEALTDAGALRVVAVDSMPMIELTLAR